MATPTTSEAPPTPGEGEFVLTKPSHGFSLSPELTAKLTQAASGGSAPPQEEATPAPVKPTPPAAPKPPSQPPKAAPTPAPKQEGTSTPPPATPTPETPKAEEAPTEQLKGPKQLREAYERAQARLTELETTVGATTKEKLEAVTKLAKAEESLTAAQKRLVEEYEPLRKVHEEQAKRLQEREEALMLARYESTDEYHSTYVKPIADARQEALQFMGELVVQTPEGKEIPASQEHLNYVLSAPNNNEAARRAEQLLGQGSPFIGQIVNYRTRLRALEGKRQEGLQQGQLKAKAYFEKQQVAQAQHLESLKAAVKQREATYLTEVGAVDDPELVQALSEGRALADRLVDEMPTMTFDAVADTLAKSRASIQGYKVLQKVNARQAAEIAALKGQLAAYTSTEPAVETRNGGPVPSPEGSSELQGGTYNRLMDSLLSKAVKAATR